MNILVGMSGGIDSTVTAYLLKKQGHNVMGSNMIIWRHDSPYPAPLSVNSCYNLNTDKTELYKLCDKVGVPLKVLNCSEKYEKIVLENFKNEYLNARTPNPCVWCNSKIKFGAMVDYAKEEGLVFDKFATGHYARINYNETIGRYELLKGKDLKKDQSYFLYRLTQEQLSRTLFPLGEMTKEEIRKIDVEQGYHDAEQVESQDFYGGDYSDLLRQEDKIGNIVTTDGEILGQHNGFWHYTIGQRKGLGIAAKEPLYVLELDSKLNEVIVGFDSQTEQHIVYVNDVNYVSATSFEDKIYSAKIRSASPGVDCKIEKTEDGFKALFLKGVKAAAAGQSLVVYEDDKIIAGGLIYKAE